MKLEKGKAEERKGNMSKIFKNMIPYWKSIVIIIALLFVQAWCDLSLPSYTSDIIDVGIQNYGVEHVVPEALTADEFETAELFMTDEEADLWESIYEQDGDIYRLQVTAESELNEIDDTLAVPLIMNYQMSVMEDSAVKEHVAKPTGADAGTLEKDTLLSMRDSMEETIDTMGSSLVKSMGAAYAVSCDKAAGIDVEKIQKSYLVTAGLKMVGMALMIGIVTVLVGFLSQVAVLMKHGLTEETAYKCVTIRAAKALDLADELGSIEPGKAADVVIWESEPFKAGGRPRTVLINGKIQYQTEN